MSQVDYLTCAAIFGREIVILASRSCFGIGENA